MLNLEALEMQDPLLALILPEIVEHPLLVPTMVEDHQAEIKTELVVLFPFNLEVISLSSTRPVHLPKLSLAPLS